MRGSEACAARRGGAGGRRARRAAAVAAARHAGGGSVRAADEAGAWVVAAAVAPSLSGGDLALLLDEVVCGAELRPVLPAARGFRRSKEGRVRASSALVAVLGDGAVVAKRQPIARCRVAFRPRAAPGGPPAAAVVEWDPTRAPRMGAARLRRGVAAALLDRAAAAPGVAPAAAAAAFPFLAAGEVSAAARVLRGEGLLLAAPGPAPPPHRAALLSAPPPLPPPPPPGGGGVGGYSVPPGALHLLRACPY